jgi:hypothetical protein
MIWKNLGNLASRTEFCVTTGEHFGTRAAWTAKMKLCDQSDPYPSCDSLIRSFPIHDYAINRVVSSDYRLPFGSCPVRILADTPYSCLQYMTEYYLKLRC